MFVRDGASIKESIMKIKNSKDGQTLVEYILIVVVIALAAMAIVGVFSTRVQAIWGGAAKDLGADSSAVDSAVGQDPVQKLKSYDNPSSSSGGGG